MVIYIDFILLINFFFDLIILITESIILKRNKKIYRLVLASLVGSLSVLILFINVNNITLFLIKLLISVLMIFISFGFKYFWKNFLYLYFISIILGGFLYFINNTFSYEVKGLLFINNGYSINLIFLIIISPLILYFYVKDVNYKKNINKIHLVSFEYLDKFYEVRGYIDTGNNLYDPYFHKPVFILYNKKIQINNPIYIPYNTISDTGILKAFKPNNLKIDGKIYYDILIGICDKKFNLYDCDMIIHSKIDV